MISINLPASLEEHFQNVVHDNYGGDITVAIAAFLELHEKYGWKEQLRKDVLAVRKKVRKIGGIDATTIGQAVQKHRKKMHKS